MKGIWRVAGGAVSRMKGASGGGVSERVARVHESGEIGRLRSLNKKVGKIYKKILTNDFGSCIK